MTVLTRGVSGAGIKFCVSEAVARAVFLEKQATKKACVVSDGVEVSIVLSAEEGVLFP